MKQWLKFPTGLMDTLTGKNIPRLSNWLAAIFVYLIDREDLVYIM